MLRLPEWAEWVAWAVCIKPLLEQIKTPPLHGGVFSVDNKETGVFITPISLTSKNYLTIFGSNSLAT